MLQSYQGLLFQAIQQQIKDKVPEIRWIDMEMSQLENYLAEEKMRPPVSFPCVLIDFPQTQYEEMSQGAQWATITIEVRLAFAQFSNTSQITPKPVQEIGLEYFEIEMRLVKALQGFMSVRDDGSPVHQPLIRVSASTERRQYDTINMRVRSLVFTTALEDFTIANQFDTKNPGLSIEL